MMMSRSSTLTCTVNREQLNQRRFTLPVYVQTFSADSSCVNDAARSAGKGDLQMHDVMNRKKKKSRKKEMR